MSLTDSKRKIAVSWADGVPHDTSHNETHNDSMPNFNEDSGPTMHDDHDDPPLAFHTEDGEPTLNFHDHETSSSPHASSENAVKSQQRQSPRNQIQNTPQQQPISPRNQQQQSSPPRFQSPGSSAADLNSSG